MNQATAMVNCWLQIGATKVKQGDSWGETIGYTLGYADGESAGLTAGYENGFTVGVTKAKSSNSALP